MNEVEINDCYIWVNMPGQKLNRAASPNGRAHWRTKANVVKEQRTQVDRAFKASLRDKFGNDATAGDALTAFQKYPVQETFPLEILFERQYTGKAQKYDDDNLRAAWKAYRDGLAAALSLPNDGAEFMRCRYDQVRLHSDDKSVKGGLYIRVSPAWLKKFENEQQQQS